MRKCGATAVKEEGEQIKERGVCERSGFCGTAGGDGEERRRDGGDDGMVTLSIDACGGEGGEERKR